MANDKVLLKAPGIEPKEFDKAHAEKLLAMENNGGWEKVAKLTPKQQKSADKAKAKADAEAANDEDGNDGL